MLISKVTLDIVLSVWKVYLFVMVKLSLPVVPGIMVGALKLLKLGISPGLAIPTSTTSWPVVKDVNKTRMIIEIRSLCMNEKENEREILFIIPTEFLPKPTFNPIPLVVLD